MLFVRTPADFAGLSERYTERMAKGRHHDAWALCVAYYRKRAIDDPAWLFGAESATVSLMMLSE